MKILSRSVSTLGQRVEWNLDGHHRRSSAHILQGLRGRSPPGQFLSSPTTLGLSCAEATHTATQAHPPGLGLTFMVWQPGGLRSRAAGAQCSQATIQPPSTHGKVVIVTSTVVYVRPQTSTQQGSHTPGLS